MTVDIALFLLEMSFDGYLHTLSTNSVNSVSTELT